LALSGYIFTGRLKLRAKIGTVGNARVENAALENAELNADVVPHFSCRAFSFPTF